MNLSSCLYLGGVRHRRFHPRQNAFRYRLFMVYLDLAELSEVFRGRWLWSAGPRPALAWFRRRDHLGERYAHLPLDEAVRRLVADQTGARPQGPIRLLTHLRYFGYCFNPVTFFYCFEPEGRRVEAIVAEVRNTPWGERHPYVLIPEAAPGGGSPRLQFRFQKRFHVSPFMDMDVEYDWRFSAPSRRLAVHMENRTRGQRFFDATLCLRREAISTASLGRALAAYPFMTGTVVAAIYWQALRLWFKRAPFYTHPAKRKESKEAIIS